MRSFMVVSGLAVAVSACGSSGRTNSDCRQAAANAIALLRAKVLADGEKEMGEKFDEPMRRLAWGLVAEKAGLPLEPEKQVEVLANTCRVRKDGQGKRNCVARARSVEELNACGEVMGSDSVSESVPPVAPPAASKSDGPDGPPPVRVTITLDSEPQGAEIYDSSTQTVVGVTPFEFEVPGSREPRQLTLRLAGYRGKTIEFIPDKDVDLKSSLKALDGK